MNFIDQLSLVLIVNLVLHFLIRKDKLADKFPQLGLSNKGKLFIHEDEDVILITKHPNEGIIVKTSGSYHVGKCANWIMLYFKPYTGPKIDLNKVFNNH